MWSIVHIVRGLFPTPPPPPTPKMREPESQREREPEKLCTMYRSSGIIVRLLFGHCAEGLSGRPLEPQSVRESIRRFCFSIFSALCYISQPLCGTMLLHKGPAQCTVRAESLCTLCRPELFSKKQLCTLCGLFFRSFFFL